LRIRGSFGYRDDRDVTAVGRELDQKLAAMLDHLDVGVPADCSRAD